jgi:hypothetical protein
MSVGYSINCSIGSVTQAMSAVRRWNSIGVDGAGNVSCFDPAPSYLYLKDSLVGPNYCSPSTYLNPFKESASGNATVTECHPLAANGSISRSGTHTPDPAPGHILMSTTSRKEMRLWLDSGDPDKIRHATYHLAVFDDPSLALKALLRDGTWVDSPSAQEVIPGLGPMPGGPGIYTRSSGKCCQ